MNEKRRLGHIRVESLIRAHGNKLTFATILVFIACCDADQMKNGHYLLNFGLHPRSKEILPEAALELRVDEDSIFIYDTVMGAVDSRKNEKQAKIKYQNRIFRIKSKADTVYWVGDSTTWIWVEKQMKKK